MLEEGWLCPTLPGQGRIELQSGFYSRKKRSGVRGQLMSTFTISVSWKCLPGLPPCNSGVFRKHLDIVGEILQLLSALGEPVAKAYGSHLECLHTY